MPERPGDPSKGGRIAVYLVIAFFVLLFLAFVALIPVVPLGEHWKADSSIKDTPSSTQPNLTQPTGASANPSLLGS